MVYIITGGPGFGKTSLLNELEGRGFNVCPEEARALLNGVSMLPTNFEQIIANHRLRFLHSADPDKVAFADRGLPDQIAYSWYKNKQPSSFIEELVSSNKYAPIVFMTPPWENIYTKDEIRKENFKEACQIHNHIIQAYLKYGYQIIDLPFSSPADRAEFILNFLGI
jgi:predicted ATPase